MTNADREAQRRVNVAADLIQSAVRIGADPVFVADAVRAAVNRGAEQYAEDVIDAYRGSK